MKFLKAAQFSNIQKFFETAQILKVLFFNAQFSKLAIFKNYKIFKNFQFSKTAQFSEIEIFLKIAQFSNIHFLQKCTICNFQKLHS